MAPLHWNLCALDLGLGELNTHKYYLFDMKWKQGADDDAAAAREHKSRIFISYIKINVDSVLLAALGDIQHFQLVNDWDDIKLF